MTSIKNLLGHTAIYGLSTILGRLLNYLLVPLYTQVFVPGEYGIVTELYAYVAFLNVVFTFGMETAYFRFATKYKDRSSAFFNLSLTLLILISFVLGGGIILASAPIANMLEYPDQVHLIRWLGFILVIDTIVAIPFAHLRLTNKAFRFASYRLISIAANLFLNIFFLLFLPDLINSNPQSWLTYLYFPELGVGYVFLSNLIANSLYILFFLPSFFRYRPSLPMVEVAPVIRYAGPLVILGLAGVTNEMFSRAMLKYWLPEGFYGSEPNLVALGIFGACYKLAVLMTLAVQAFRYAFEPFFFNQSQSEDAQNVYASVMNGFIVFASVAWMGITLILPEIAPIFLRQPEYLEGLGVVPILLGAGLLLGVYYNLSVWYKLTDKTHYGATISTLGAVATVILNFAMIPVWGYMGSAWAALISYLIMVVMSYFWGQKHYPVKYHLPSGLLYLVYTSLVVGFLTYTESQPIIRYGIGGLLILVFSGSAYIIERKRYVHALDNH